MYRPLWGTCRRGDSLNHLRLLFDQRFLPYGYVAHELEASAVSVFFVLARLTTISVLLIIWITGGTLKPPAPVELEPSRRKPLDVLQDLEHMTRKALVRTIK